jgi:uncharacterized DUF497 family protein
MPDRRKFLWTEIDFEWDRHNLPKLAQEGFHQKSSRSPVYQAEAEEVFYNSHLILGPKRVNNEDRYYVLGSTDAGRLLFQVFVFKSPADSRRPKVRPISARDMEQHEAKKYLTAIEEEEDAE